MTGTQQSKVPVFTHVFNVCLSTGVYPTKMQQAKLTALFKSGDRNDMSNYRPVSVLPVISKGLENVICKRVVSSPTANKSCRNVILAQKCALLRLER